MHRINSAAGRLARSAWLLIQEKTKDLFRAVNAGNQRLFNVGGAAGPRIEVDHGGQLIGIFLPQEMQSVADIIHDLVRLQYHDMYGKINRSYSSVVLAAAEQETAGPGDRCLAIGNTGLRLFMGRIEFSYKRYLIVDKEREQGFMRAQDFGPVAAFGQHAQIVQQVLLRVAEYKMAACFGKRLREIFFGRTMTCACEQGARLSFLRIGKRHGYGFLLQGSADLP